MNILEGTDVIVSEPFPLQELPSAVQWTYCYKTLFFSDQGPKTNDEIQAHLKSTLELPNVRSWAIIDKNNLTNVKNTIPIVGLIYFERSNSQNGYCHITTHRRAWGNIVEYEGTKKLLSDFKKETAPTVLLPGLAEQAGRLIIDDIFKNDDILLRMSIATLAANKAACNFAARLGFKRDGYFANMVTVKGKPSALAHMGLLRG